MILKCLNEITRLLYVFFRLPKPTTLYNPKSMVRGFEVNIGLVEEAGRNNKSLFTWSPLECNRVKIDVHPLIGKIRNLRVDYTLQNILEIE